MAGLGEAARIAMELPEVTTGTSYGSPAWLVDRTVFAWSRPFRKADLRRFGDAQVPTGPLLAVRVADLRAKDALIATAPRGVFTIPHFDGFPAVLVQLDVVAKRVLRRLVADAWLACAQPALVARSRVRVRDRTRTRASDR